MHEEEQEEMKEASKDEYPECLHHASKKHEEVKAVHYVLMPTPCELTHLTPPSSPSLSNQCHSFNEQSEKLQQVFERIWYKQ